MKKFLVFWDCYGLESCIDITEGIERGNNFEKEKIFALLVDPSKEPTNVHVKELNRLVNHMMLRAQVNSQRNYELYMINSQDGIEQKDITEWFELCPQSAADFCRANGAKLVSYRATDQERRVIK